MERLVHRFIHNDRGRPEERLKAHSTQDDSKTILSDARKKNTNSLLLQG